MRAFIANTIELVKISLHSELHNQIRRQVNDITSYWNFLIYCSITLFHTAIKRIPKCALALKKRWKPQKKKAIAIESWQINKKP
ncbi:hypothetical protein SEEC0006_14587 [Salmonella enterica subsp. enterica serovar Choleraesuis str. 0006]|nr:hypothetical protein SEEC0006_14587 [Salmonella enterica subsp. enterica serovar Choleraesuis str. 0006]